MNPHVLICAVRGHAWTTWRQAVLLGARRPICARCGALKTTGHPVPAKPPAVAANPSTDGSLPPCRGGGRFIPEARP